MHFLSTLDASGSYSFLLRRRKRRCQNRCRRNDLGHRVVRTNLEHVNVMRPPDRKIDDCSSTAKDRKQDDRGGKSMPRMIADVRKAAEEPDGN